MENYKILYEELLSKFEQLQKDYSDLEKLSQDKIAAAVNEGITFSPEDIDYLDTTFGMIWLESVMSIHAEKDGVEETWRNPHYSSDGSYNFEPTPKYYPNSYTSIEKNSIWDNQTSSIRR